MANPEPDNRAVLKTQPMMAGQDQPRVADEARDVPLLWNKGDIILDLYEVKDIFTGGGMGLVYKVHHKNWNVDLAVKSPRPDYFQTEEQKENFIRECETWINLGLHPHTVSCHYVRNLGGIPRVFAEYVEGGSLKEWIESKKLYEGGKEEALKRILDIAIQMAWGLQYAHEKGLIHQDMKPANVIMTSDGTAKVTDFGLAKARVVTGEQIAGGGQKSILVSSGGMTPAYCSPEQAEGKPLTRATDIWSWAVSVLEMFTGEVTWAAGQIAGEALTSYLEIQKEDNALPIMSDGLAKVLKSCLQYESEIRLGEFGEIVARLIEVYQQAVGQSYSRPVPKPAELLADALNNQALSMLDLCKSEEAEHLWEGALKADPRHHHATYNRGLYLWRCGRMNDDALVDNLEAVLNARPSDWETKYLLGLVHLERGDAETARKLLQDAADTSPDRIEVVSALRLSEREDSQLVTVLHRYDYIGLDPVAITSNGQFAFAAPDSKPPVLQWRNLMTGEREWHLKGSPPSGDYIRCVAITPDGRWGLSGSYHGCLCFWDIGKRRLERLLLHRSPITSIAVSNDGRFAISGSGDKVYFWDLKKKLFCRARHLSGHTDEVLSLALTGDGKLAISGSADGTARLWLTGEGRCLLVLKGHSGPINSVSITADAKVAVTGSDDQTIRVWNLVTGECTQTLRAAAGGVAAVRITSDGSMAMSHAMATVQIWDIQSGRCRRSLEGELGNSNGAAMALTPDGRYAIVRARQRMEVWRIAGEQLPKSPWSYAYPEKLEKLTQEKVIVENTLTRADNLLAAGSYREAFEELKNARRVPGYHRSPEVMKYWRRLALAGRRQGINGAWARNAFHGHEDCVECVAITPDGLSVISASQDKTLRIWDLETGRCLHTLQGHTQSVNSVAVSSNGDVVISGSDDGSLRLWDIKTGRCLRILKADSTRIKAVDFTPDGRFAVAAHSNHVLRLWSLTQGIPVRVFEGHQNEITDVKVSQDQQFIVSSDERSVRIWDFSTGKCIKSCKAGYFCLKIALLSSGRQMVLGEREKVSLWDMESGKSSLIAEMFSPLTDLRGCTFAVSSDARFILVGGFERMLKLFDMVGRHPPLLTLSGHKAGITSMCFSRDAGFAVSGGDDKTVRLWEFDWNYEFLDPVEWDEGARPYLETFLTLHTPYFDSFPSDDRQPSEEEIRRALPRQGSPSWKENDFQNLVRQLQNAGYGWLRSEGVRRELEKMAKEWTGPRLLAGLNQK